MSWYRTYRPSSVAGLHLVKVRQGLQDLMKSGSFPHALLFAGPKGAGKTSAARIIGAMLNDPQNRAAVEHIFFGKGKAKADGKKPGTFSTQLLEPNQADPMVERILRGQSFVVNELDAASNRGIDDIRQLKERLYLPPQEGQIAVYILDEVHMLTTEAFNALLKMLEEPPSHVVFILATTERQKIPETVLSRCTLIQFYRASDEELTEALHAILQVEKISEDPEALAKIVRLADGSFRDGVKYLEMAAAGEKALTMELVESRLHLTSVEQIRALVHAIVEKQEQAVTELFAQLRTTGSDQESFHRAVVKFLHSDLMKAIAASDEQGPAEFDKKISHYLLTQLLSVPVADTAVPFLGLELKALEMIFKAKERGTRGGATGAGEASHGSVPGSSVRLSPKQTARPSYLDLPVESVANVVPVAIREVETISQVDPVTDRVIASQTTTVVTPFVDTEADGALLLEKWDQFLALVKAKNSSIEAVLRSARPVQADRGRAKIEVFYQFHKDQLRQPKFLKILEECSAQLAGGKIVFEFGLADKAIAGAQLSNVSAKVNEEDELIKLAKDIFI